MKRFIFYLLYLSIVFYLFACKNNNKIKHIENETISSSSAIKSTYSSIKRFSKKATLQEFLSNAIKPLGTTLYIYGGGWDYDEEMGDSNAMSFGIAKSWADFFYSQNEYFVYKDSKHKNTSYFPFNGKNIHHKKGLDCSGYLGWIMYNTFNGDNEKINYTYNTKNILRTYVNDFKIGTKENIEDDYIKIFEHLFPGDIVVIDGHLYIIVGKCKDNSILIIHSSVTKSITGSYGGGVQFSAININKSEDKNCEAYKLANAYTAKYFPEWHRRYPTIVKPTEKYLKIYDKNNDSIGVFHFDEKILSDSNNMKNKTASEILKILFTE